MELVGASTLNFFNTFGCESRGRAGGRAGELPSGLYVAAARRTSPVQAYFVRA